MLAASRLTKHHGHVAALDDVSLEIRPGELTAVVGPSGSGKTSLLRTLALLEAPDSGLVSIDGVDYAFPSPGLRGAPAPWPRVTVVFQQLFLWPHLTLRENILLPLRRRVRRADALSRLDSLVELLDMRHFVDRRPTQVSGGQRQRAALARALALNPTYLLLDEITSALDIEQSHALLSHLIQLRNNGIGILLITHMLDFVRAAADHIVFLDHGSVVEVGAPSRVLDTPVSPRLKRFLSYNLD